MAHAQGHTNQAAPREPVGAAQADKGDKEEEEEEEALRVIAHEIEQHSGLQCECYQGWRQRISFAMRGRLDYYRVSALEYAKMLCSNGEERALMSQSLLMSITMFYRNRRYWDHIASLARDRPRCNVWIAGCATGEEAYTAMMVLDWNGVEVGTMMMIATDVDDDALGCAREGIYPPSTRAQFPTNVRDELPCDWVEKYFEAVREVNAHVGSAERGDSGSAGDTTERLRVKDTFRERIRWQRHNLCAAATDAWLEGATRESGECGGPENDALPCSDFDFICCRNVLMYFEESVQLRVLSMYAAALARSCGFLLLGDRDVAALALLHSGDIFEPVPVPGIDTVDTRLWSVAAK